MAGARIVVVGGGFAGLSVAARLAKLRHRVTLVEATAELGGRLRGVEIDGEHFCLCSPHVTLPGVFRDVFRKSGRTIDRVIGFEPIGGRDHFFYDQDPLHLPMGNRGDQVAALTARFGEDPGWSAWLDTMPPRWELLRRIALDRITRGRPDFSREQFRALAPRRRLSREVRRALKREEVDRIALDRHTVAGHDPAATPAFVAVVEYLERNFGLWAFAGGHRALADALERRLAERRVEVRRGLRAEGVIRDGGDVVGVDTAEGEIGADIVVWCAPPLEPPGREMPVIAAGRTFLSLDDSASSLPLEAMVHADPPLRLYREGHRVTLEHRGGEDPLVALHRCGIDLRGRVRARHDLSAVHMAGLGHWGYVWNRWTTAVRVPGIAPAGGLFHAGAHAHPGGALEMIGMATAAIAGHIGPAPR